MCKQITLVSKISGIRKRWVRRKVDLPIWNTCEALNTHQPLFESLRGKRNASFMCIKTKENSLVLALPYPAERKEPLQLEEWNSSTAMPSSFPRLCFLCFRFLSRHFIAPIYNTPTYLISYMAETLGAS